MTSSPLSNSSVDFPALPKSTGSEARRSAKKRARRDGREGRGGSLSPVARKLSWTPPPPSPPQGPRRTPAVSVPECTGPANTVESFAEADAVESDETFSKWGPSGEASFALIPPPALARSPAVKTPRKERRDRLRVPERAVKDVSDRTRLRRASGATTSSAASITSPAASSNTALEVSPPTDINLSPNEDAVDSKTRRRQASEWRRGSSGTSASSNAGSDRDAVHDKERKMQSIRDALQVRELEATNASRFKDFLMSQLRQLEKQNALLLEECDEGRQAQKCQRSMTRLQLAELEGRLALSTEHHSALLEAMMVPMLTSHASTRNVYLKRIREAEQRASRCRTEASAMSRDSQRERAALEGLVAKLRDDLAVQEEEAASLQARLADVAGLGDSGSAALRQERDLLQEKVDELVSQMAGMSSASQQADSLEAELARQRRLCDTLQDQLVNESAARHRLEGELRRNQSLSPQRTCTSGSSTPPRTPEALHASLRQAEEEVKALRKELDSSNSSLLAARAERDAYVQKLADSSSGGLRESDVTIALLRADLADCREGMRSRKQDLAKASAQEDLLRCTVSDRDATIDQLKLALTEAESQLSEQQGLNELCSKTFKDQALLDASLAASERRLKAALDDAQQRSMQLEIERARAEEMRESLVAIQTSLTEEKTRVQRLSVANEQLQHSLDDALLKGSTDAASSANRMAAAEKLSVECKEETARVKESAHTMSESVRHLSSLRDTLQQQIEELRKDKDQELDLLRSRLEATERRMKNFRDEKSSQRDTFDAALHQVCTQPVWPACDAQAAADLKEVETELARQKEQRREDAAKLRESQNAAKQARDALASVRDALSQAEKEKQRLAQEAEEAALAITSLQERVKEDAMPRHHASAQSSALAALLHERSQDTTEDPQISFTLTDDKQLPFSINDAPDDVLAETKKLLHKADSAIASERRKAKSLKAQLQEAEVSNTQLSREVKVLRYRVQVLTTALTSDEGSGCDASELGMGHDDDASVASSAVSGLTALRRQLRDKGEQLARMQVPGRAEGARADTSARPDEAPSFQSMVGHIAELKKRHHVPSGASSRGSPTGRKRRANSASGSWRTAISPVLSCSSVH